MFTTYLKTLKHVFVTMSFVDIVLDSDSYYFFKEGTDLKLSLKLLSLLKVHTYVQS